MEAIDIYKGFKFRLYPNNTQSKKINKNFGYNRFVYNYYLTKIIKEGYKSTSYYIKDYTTRLKYEYQFLWEADPMLIKKIIFKLEDNYVNGTIKLTNGMEIEAEIQGDVELKGGILKFEVTELDDLKDYLYDGNAMRTLAGKKLHKKKNRLNKTL